MEDEQEEEDEDETAGSSWVAQEGDEELFDEAEIHLGHGLVLVVAMIRVSQIIVSKWNEISRASDICSQPARARLRGR